MMRSLLVFFLAISLLNVVSCATDSAPSSDDEVASGSDNATPADSGSDDLSNELSDDGAKPEDKPSEKTADTSEQSLEEELDGNDKQADQVTPEAEPVPATPEPTVEAETLPLEELSPAAPQEKVRITNIRFLANQAGGTIVVEGSGPLISHTRSQGADFVIEIENAELPPKLKHPYPLREFNGAFTNLVADDASGIVQILIQSKAGRQTEPIVQNEANSLIVIPASMPSTVADTSTKSKSDQVESFGEPLAARTLDDFLTGNQKFYGKPVSLQTKDADVRDVINFLAEESGANIVMSDDVKGHVSIKVRKIPWDQALVSVMRSKKLGYVRQGNVIRISSMAELQEETDTSYKIIETQKNLAPVRVKVIPVNYASVDDLAKQVPPFLSKEGKVVVDQRSNTILVTDREVVLDKVERIIKALDVQPNQVLIEGKIVEAQENFTSFLGVNWGMSGSPVAISNSGGANGSPLEFNPSLSSTSYSPKLANVFTGSLSIGTLDFFGNLTASLGLAEQESIAKVISSPRITTMNKEKAQISQIGEQVTISTTVNNVSNERTTQEKRTPVALDLIVTPQITADASVIMDVEIKRQFAGAVIDAQTQARPINTRTAKTKILVRNGQTAVIGGIYQNDETQADTGIPGLKDIPVLGWLFKSRSKEKNKNELLIFLTPRIMQNLTSDTSNNASM
jgi:type IV pilus assembly protein PilQ